MTTRRKTTKLESEPANQTKQSPTVSRVAEDDATSTTATSTVKDATSELASTVNTTISDYEAKRQQQIQRNQQILSELTGLTNISTSLSVATASARSAKSAELLAERRAAAAKKRKEREEMYAIMPRRDLPGRRAKGGGVNYNEDELATAQVTAKAAAAGNSNEHGDTEMVDAEPRPNADLSDFVVPDHYPINKSVSQKSSQVVPTLPLSELSHYLGQWIPLTYHSPKAAAMSFLTTGWPSPTNKASQRAPPTFNRMSGIQKLANHIAIFVNIDTPEEIKAAGHTYNNQWHDGGRRITWYAQPSQRVETPVVGQIIAAVRTRQKMMDGSAKKEGDAYAQAVLQDAAASASSSAEEPPKKKTKRAASTATSSTSTTTAAASSSSTSTASSTSSSELNDPFSILLFLRFAPGTYVYGGPLAYHSHDTTRIPMKFIFTLTEFDRLIQQKDFRELLPQSITTTKKEPMKGEA